MVWIRSFFGEAPANGFQIVLGNLFRMCMKLTVHLGFIDIIRLGYHADDADRRAVEAEIISSGIGFGRRRVSRAKLPGLLFGVAFACELKGANIIFEHRHNSSPIHLV